MKQIAIDIGTYSIKFLEYEIERKSINYLGFNEVIISEFTGQLSDVYSFVDLQTDIIRSYLKDIHFEGNLIYQIPNNLTTIRILHLPIKNKKKALQMIPFQLDEDLPYSSGSIHFDQTFISKKDGLHALVVISSKSEFEEYFNYLKRKEILPYILTAEISIFQNYALSIKGEKSFAIIDLGHTTTKGYFFHMGRVVSSHTSYVAGKIIDEVLSQTYQISIEQAIVYKHENCFLLTEAQFDDIDDDQKDFSILMDQIFAPLISDITKWDLGFKVNYGHGIDSIYLVGGTSNIKNINNYLATKLSIKVSSLHAFTESHPKLPPNIKDQKTYTLNNLMALSVASKIPLINLRSGDFSSLDLEKIPLHTAAFVFARVIIIFVMLFSTLMVERLFLYKQDTAYDTRIKQIIKKPLYKISTNDQRFYFQGPEKIHRIFKLKENEIQQEISSLQSATNINIIEPLVKLGLLLKGQNDIELIEYSSDLEKASAVFSTESMEQLNQLKDILEKGAPNIDDVAIEEKALQLTLKMRN